MLTAGVVREAVPVSPMTDTKTTLRHPVRLVVRQTARAVAHFPEPGPGTKFPWPPWPLPLQLPSLKNSCKTMLTCALAAVQLFRLHQPWPDAVCGPVEEIWTLSPRARGLHEARLPGPRLVAEIVPLFEVTAPDTGAGAGTAARGCGW